MPRGGPDGGDGGDGRRRRPRGRSLDHHTARLPLPAPLHGGAGPARQGREQARARAAATPSCACPSEPSSPTGTRGEPLGDLTTPGQRLLVARGRARRPGQCAIRQLDEPRPAPRRSRARGRGAMDSPRAQAPGRRGGRGLSQRGQVHARVAAVRRHAEDRGLSVHDARARAGHRPGGRAFDASSSPTCPVSSPAPRRARGSGTVSSGTPSARDCWSISSTSTRRTAASRCRTGRPSRTSSPAYSDDLAARPQIVAANKSELPGTEERRRAVEDFCAARGLSFHAISAVTGLGLSALVRDIAGHLASERWVAAEP